MGVINRPVDIIFRPERLVDAHEEIYGGNWRRNLRIALRLFAFYVVNVVLYAAPLTLAGFGRVQGSITTPGIVSALDGFMGVASQELWRFCLTLAQNSAYLFIATILTLVTFHVGVVLSGSSEGLLLSIRTVTYSTGLYLAAIFTFVWYLSTSGAVQTADELLLGVQTAFVYVFIDLLGSDLALQAGRPEAIPTEGLTAIGITVVTLLVVAALYYIYLLYLGARITHGASRYQSLMAVGFVVVSPVLYVVGSILAFQILGGGLI